MGIRWDEGLTLWLIPHRYWEAGDQPIECRLVEKPDTADNPDLFVFHSKFGHNAYVPAESCYQNRESAIIAAHLLTELKKLKFKDECDWLCEKIHRKRRQLKD